jgi:hypothetical protein
VTASEQRALRAHLDELIGAFAAENLDAGDLPDPVAPLAAHPNAPLNAALAALDDRYGPEIGYDTRVLVTHVEQWTRREVGALVA